MGGDKERMRRLIVVKVLKEFRVGLMGGEKKVWKGIMCC